MIKFLFFLFLRRARNQSFQRRSLTMARRIGQIKGVLAPLSMPCCQMKTLGFLQLRHYSQSRSGLMKILPNRSLVDETLKITVEGLHPKQEVSILSQIQENEARFCSHAHYIADDHGQIDLSHDVARPGGSYDGVEPMGLIWSQKQEPGQKSGIRLVKSDVASPLLTHFYALDGFQTVEDCLKSVSKEQWLTSLSCERWYMADGVQRFDVRDGGLLATLFIPKGDGPFPGVLDMFGTIGGLTEHRSALLASRGIASLALQYFQSSPTFDGGMRSDVEYYEEAVDYLLNHPKVMKPYAGIIGNSQGGTEAFLLSSLCPNKVRACVIINAAHIVNLFTHTYKEEEFPSPGLYTDNVLITDDGVIFSEAIEAFLKEKDNKYIIPLERSKCSYLLIHGEDDKCFPGSAGDYTMQYLEDCGKTSQRLLKYPAAGHLLEPPHSPHFYSTYHAKIGNMMVWGGEPRQHARAQEQSWPQILHFINSALVEANIKS